MTARVAVCGPGDGSPEEVAAAEEVGRLLGAEGITVITGGHGGVMEAASKGARESGGTTVGILPGTDAGEANPYCTVVVPTGLGEGRNLLVVRNADVVIAVGGGYGTLSEIALALKLGVPVVGLGTWELYRPGHAGEDHFVRAGTAAEAVALAIRGGGPGLPGG